MIDIDRSLNSRYHAHHLMTRYSKATKRLVELHNLYCPTPTRSPSILTKRIKDVAAFLEHLGNPQQNYKIVHVTGTSGKGSVTKLVHNIIHTSGKKVGSLISPHTTTLMDCFLLDDALMPANAVTESIEEIEKAYETYLEKHPPLAYMALRLAVGLNAMAKLKVDWVVVEVGCGGRYDDTNAIENTEATIITNVDKDHTQILGNTLEEIAFEKAGIIKKQGLTIVGEERSRLKKIFTDEAIEQEATLFFAREETPVENKSLAPYENKNRRLAYITMRELGFDEEIIKTGIEKNRRMPCRFEAVQETPTVILDGSHNPAKVAATVDSIKLLPEKPVILFGTGAGKEANIMLRKLTPVAKTIHTTRTRMPHKKAFNPFTALKLIPASKRGKAYLNPEQALEEVLKTLKKDETLIIIGSLYLTGELRTKWYPEEKIIKQATSFPI